VIHFSLPTPDEILASPMGKAGVRHLKPHNMHKHRLHQPQLSPCGRIKCLQLILQYTVCLCGSAVDKQARTEHSVQPTHPQESPHSQDMNMHKAFRICTWRAGVQSCIGLPHLFYLWQPNIRSVISDVHSIMWSD